MAIFTTLSVVIWFSSGILGSLATLVYVFTMRVVIYDTLNVAFSILGTSKSRKELCRDCTEASEAVRSCVSPKIAAQGSMNALARYRGEEASHRLTRNAVVFFSRHRAIFSELQRNILC